MLAYYTYNTFLFPQAYLYKAVLISLMAKIMYVSRCSPISNVELPKNKGNYGLSYKE